MPTPSSSNWLNGPAAMVCRIRQHDWSATPLGPLDRWSASLRHALMLVLDHPLPMVRGWGTNLTTIYNDPYRPPSAERSKRWAILS